jgi:NAD(P)-dependent dehydrogenase (short-subunit alcohol dehydrogenase family)
MAKVAVVTGGTVGIGLATVRLFAERGWSVGVIARDEARLRSTETELRALGVEVLGISADVADAAAMDQAADRFEAELGPIAAWVNNAMATVVSPAGDITPEEYKRVTEVTYLGQVHGTLAALRLMTPRNAGAIVQVSSGLAIRSAPLQSAYCGAKAATRGFTDSVRSELIHDNVKITLSIVYLPAVNTPQFDWSRNHTGRAQKAPEPIFDPRLCAEAIVFAAVKPRREIWVGRSVAQMGAVQRLSPHLGDRVAASMWDGQLEDFPPAHPEGNLFEPVPGNPGIDGRFTDRSKTIRTEFWTSRQRDVFYGTLASVALLGMSAPLLMGAAVLKAMDQRK